MSEFTEKLNSSELISNAWDEIDRDRASAGLLIDVIKIEFKDWQPPKELVVVPKFFADWFENQLKNNESKKFDGNDVFRIIQDVIKVSNDESTWEDYGITDEIAKFAEDNEELFLNLIVNCSLGNGYTVEKERVYILKHIDLSKNDKEKDWYLAKKVTGKLYHSCGEKGRGHKGMIEGQYFTQSEIDELETGSYEQIEVDE